MKSMIFGATAALAMLSFSALAGDRTLDPNDITVQAKRPPLQLNESQRSAIQEGLETENTEQKMPPNYQPKVGDTIPHSMSPDAMPQSLLAREPSLKQYGYAKLSKNVLVIDPMKKTIIAVLPRKTPGIKDEKPADWAAKRGRELTGQAPESGSTDTSPEPAGDAGDKANGNEKNANEK